jgi:hypothetical protein
MGSEPRGAARDALHAAKRIATAQYLSSVLPRAEIARTFRSTTRPDHNVVGVGLGVKIVKGKATSRQCVRLYVERKVGKGGLAPGQLLPATIGGVPTDVIESGRFRAFPATVPVAQRKARPARPGHSVGFRFTGAKAQFVMAGTFGAVVTDGTLRFILSNNHVLADENNLPVGSPIFQPGLLDGGNPATDQIAKLTRFVQLRTGGQNAVDAAIAEVSKATLVRGTPLPQVGRLASAQPIAAAVDMKVHKHGRTTGYTRGEVFDTSADVQVEYDAGVLTFQNQILVRGTPGSFSDSGDSGSLIVDRKSKRGTGLLFAGSASYTIANPLSDVLAALGVTLVI